MSIPKNPPQKKEYIGWILYYIHHYIRYLEEKQGEKKKISKKVAIYSKMWYDIRDIMAFGKSDKEWFSVYPLFLEPALKQYLWGGTRLQEEFGFGKDMDTVAEAWMLSCHPNGASTVRNGALAGLTLPQALDKLGKAALGGRLSVKDFPLLIKFIDARDRLSLQVHPDDAYARSVKLPRGKTEMWVVLDCQPGAELIYGLTRPVSEEELRAAVESDTMEPLCRHIPVKKGDVFYIPAGTLHAIGAGILIAEVQQNADVTYRVSDYGRLGADGKPRELHKEQAIAVISRTPTPLSRHTQSVREDATGKREMLADTPYFTVERWDLGGKAAKQVHARDTFLSLLCPEGTGHIRWEGQTESFSKGDSIFIPAGLPFVIDGQAQLLVSYVRA